jgi:hypothetical protein
MEGSSISADLSYIPQSFLILHSLEQNECNDPVRDLNLSKQKADLLGLRVQQLNFLVKRITISVLREINQKLWMFHCIHDYRCMWTDGKIGV